MTNWEKTLAEKAQRINRLQKQAVGNTRQDMTRPILEDLLDNGYQIVQWNSNGSKHSTCLDLNRQQWDIHDFISGLSHDAPMFEKSHPGCSSCSVTVSGEGLPTIELDSYGDMDETIGTSRPVRTPKTPKQIPIKEVKVKRKPKPKVVKTPTKPEKNYLYVPKKQWEEIKEQPSLHEVPEEEKSTQPTDEDREEWLKFLERETSKKIPRQIRGIS